jgi:nucleoside-diphosphate-sugar epimerase
MLTNKDLEHVFTHVEWEELRNQNVFISGGTGWFGRWMVETLLYANEKLNLNCKILVLTRHIYSSNNPAIMFWSGDVNNVVFPIGEFSHIIHLAIDGTDRMLAFADKCKAKKFLFTSSGAVYRSNVDQYAQTKIRDEYWCQSTSPPPDVKIARCFSFVGPYIPLDRNFAIGNFIGSAINDKKVFIRNAKNTPFRSYLYMADLAIWLWTILFRGEPGEFYNVGGEKEYTVKEVGEMVSRIAQVPVIYWPTENIESFDYVPFLGHTKEKLGLEEFISLEDGITRTLEFYTHGK